MPDCVLKQYLLTPWSYDHLDIEVFTLTPITWHPGHRIFSCSPRESCIIRIPLYWHSTYSSVLLLSLLPSYGALNLHETLLKQWTECSHTVNNFFLAAVVVAKFFPFLSKCDVKCVLVAERMHFHSHTSVSNQANHKANINFSSFRCKLKSALRLA